MLYFLPMLKIYILSNTIKKSVDLLNTRLLGIIPAYMNRKIK
jgi:hypothetical protein